MLKLNAYNGRDKQNLRSILTTAKRNGLTVDDLLALLDLDQEKHGLSKDVSVSKGNIVCPSCGSLDWHERTMVDGIRRMWCFACTYSKGVK